MDNEDSASDKGALGLAQDGLELRRWDPRWPRLFEREAAQLRSALGPALLDIEHIGSTAIPGMPAKPLLDMMATVADPEAVEALALPLADLGYTNLGPMGVPERTLFAKGPAALRSHHLSLVAPGSGYWRDQLLFRDYLRDHPETARDYAALKRSLMLRHPTERARYTGGKTDFVAEVLARALAARLG